MTPLLVALGLLVGGTALLWLLVQSLGVERKKAIKDALGRVFEVAEARGLYPRQPAFWTDYQRDYPKLLILEDNFEVIQRECRQLLGIKDRLTDVEALGGRYTEGGIHAIRWKSFMFKSGAFVESNCRLAPRTAALLERIPGVYTAFFSILEPKQYITPHFGYYKGFLRYHLGVMIPHDNADLGCWLRINADKADNQRRERGLIERGERYYWRNGRGVIFDDTYLHDAVNNSDQVRVVLFLDIRRKMPWYLDAFNRFCLFIAHQERSVKRIRRNATIEI